MTAVTAGPGVILEEDPRVGLSGVRSGRPVSSQPWRLHSSAFPPSATGSCSLRCTAERNGQSLLHVCIHKPAHKSPQQQPRERTGACDNNYCHFQPEPSFQRAIFPTLKSQSSPVAFTVSCSAQAKVAQDSPCLLQTLLAAVGNHNRAL